MNHLLTTITRRLVPAAHCYCYALSPPMMTQTLILRRQFGSSQLSQPQAQSQQQQQQHTKCNNNSCDDKNKRVIVKLDVSEYKPENVKVEIANESICIECHHGDQHDYLGEPTRSLKRTFTTPKELASDCIECVVTNDGVLLCKSCAASSNPIEKDKQKGNVK